jgi:hypothetical protein
MEELSEQELEELKLKAECWDMVYPTFIFLLNTIGAGTAPGSVIETWNKAVDRYNKNESV